MCHSKDASNFCVCVFKKIRIREKDNNLLSVVGNRQFTDTHTTQKKWRKVRISRPRLIDTQREPATSSPVWPVDAHRARRATKKKNKFSKNIISQPEMVFFFANINGNDVRLSRGHWGRPPSEKLMPIFIWFASRLITQTHCTHNQTGHRTTSWDGNLKKKGKTRTDYKLLMAWRWLPHMSATTFFFSFLFLVVVGGGGYLKTGEIRRRPLKNCCHGGWCLYT